MSFEIKIKNTYKLYYEYISSPLLADYTFDSWLNITYGIKLSYNNNNITWKERRQYH